MDSATHGSPGYVMLRAVDPVVALTELGGAATRGQLLRSTSRRSLEKAVRHGLIAHVARDRYCLSESDDVAIAHALSGVICLTSAALHHGWGVKHEPEQPHVSVGASRHIRPQQRRRARIHRFALSDDDIVNGNVTSKIATLTHCLRALPFDEALAIADSALRAGDLHAVRAAAALARGTGARRIRTIAAQARADATNPFESVTRAIALTVEGLRVEPQRLITSVTPWARPDLVDVDLRIVIEADSFEWHGKREALVADAARYNRLVVDGWLVLRFSWEEVMFHPERARATMVAAVERACGRTEVRMTGIPRAERRLAG